MVKGNIINLYNRPQTKPPAGPNGLQLGVVKSLSGNEYGSPVGQRSTTYSKGFSIGGKEVVLPTVVNGKFLTDDEAIDQYLKTGQHLGMFDSIPESNAFATNLHNSQQQMGNFYGGTSSLLAKAKQLRGK